MSNKLDPTDPLRAEAQARITDYTPTKEALIRPASEILHELRVHQIELEMQNETLRQAQFELSESRDRYFDLYDFAPVGYLTLTPDGIISEINLTGAGLLGLERKQLLNSRIARYIAAGDLDVWQGFFQQSQLSDSPQRCDLYFVRSDGSVFPAHLECLHKESSNATSSVRVMLTDISVQIQKQEIVRESEERLRAIFEGVLNGILLADVQTWQFSDANPAFCRMVGYSHDELIRLGIRDIHPQQDLPRVTEQFERHLRGELQLSQDIPVQRKDGSVFYVDIKSAPVTIGGKIYLLGIFRDITELRHAEAIRRISEQRHRLLFENSQDALMTLAPPSWKFSSANEATLKMFGASSEAEFTALSPWEISPERQPDGSLSSKKARQMIATTMRKGFHSFEWEHQHLNGQPFAAEVLLTRLELDDEVFLQATVRDISHRKKIESALREYQQLLRQMASQGVATREAEFKHVAREIHDELGQILTALRMEISLLRIQFGEHDPALMKKIQDMLLLMDRAIQAVRDVTGNLRPPALDMGIVPALSALCANFPPGNSNAVCTFHVVDEPATLDEARTVALFRIVQESLTNISRHAAASHVDITIGKCGEDITVIVRDDGKGFDVGVMPNKKSFGLLGMKERALALGGKVEIASVPSQGTVVSVRIPLTQTNPGRRASDKTNNC